MTVDERVGSSEVATNKGLKQRLDPPHPPRRESRSPIASPSRGTGSVATPPPKVAVSERSLGQDAAGDEQLANIVEAEIALQRRLRQASELASLLRQRQDELDRREGELNARTAAMAHEERITRLWAEEKVLEVNEDRRHLVQEAETLLEEREAFAQEQEEAQQMMQCREQELAEQAETLERERLAFALITRQVQWEHDSALQRARATEDRAAAREAEAEAEITRAESLRQSLEHQLRQVREDAADLSRNRQRLRDLVRDGQDALEAREQASQVAHEQAIFEVQRRERQLDEQARYLGEQQDSISKQHRDLVEDQIGLQQLWSKICPDADREMTTRRIGFLRLQLKEMFGAEIQRCERAEEEAQRRASEARLAEIHLDRRKHQIGEWIIEQQQAHQNQLNRLSAEAQRLRCWEARLETRRMTELAKVAKG